MMIRRLSTEELRAHIAPGRRPVHQTCRQRRPWSWEGGSRL